MLNDLRKDLMRDEGYRYDAYRDTCGLWTIGIGHMVGAGSESRIKSLTDEEITAFFEYDVKLAEDRCRRLFDPNWVLIDYVRQDALINMAFNLGNRLNAFRKFINAVNGAMNTLCNEEKWLEAGREMADSIWFKQVGQRAVRLRYMIELGERMA